LVRSGTLEVDQKKTTGKKKRGKTALLVGLRASMVQRGKKKKKESSN